MPCTLCGPGFTIPLALTSPRPTRNLVSIGEALTALWNGPEDRSASIIKPGTISRLDGFTFYPNVGLISGSDLILRPRRTTAGRPNFLGTYGRDLAALMLTFASRKGMGPFLPQVDRAGLPASWGRALRQWQSQRVPTPARSNPRSRACPL